MLRLVMRLWNLSLGGFGARAGNVEQSVLTSPDYVDTRTCSSHVFLPRPLNISYIVCLLLFPLLKLITPPTVYQYSVSLRISLRVQWLSTQSLSDTGFWAPRKICLHIYTKFTLHSISSFPGPPGYLMSILEPAGIEAILPGISLVLINPCGPGPFKSILVGTFQGRVWNCAY